MIDWSRVRELQEEVGNEDFEEVFGLFLEEVEEALSPMRETSYQSNSLEQDMHFLKGCAMSVGFEEFATLCHAGEKLAMEGREDLISIEALVVCFDQSKERFDLESKTKIQQL